MRRQMWVWLMLMLCVPSVWAQQPQEVKLDDAGETILYVYHPAKHTKAAPALLICPGGGYAGLAIDNEGHNMAKWHASNGFVAAVLKYRLPKGVHTIPLSDAEKAMSYIRGHAAEWNLNPDKVGVIGSSAGGHLAASLSTLAADENRPNFAILYYPVISLDSSITHMGTKQNLLGKEENNQAMVDRYSLHKQVDAKTPPTLLLLSDDDSLVPVQNAVLYYSALKEKNVAAAMYIFPNGEHGFGSQFAFTYYQEAKDLITKWFERLELK